MTDLAIWLGYLSVAVLSVRPLYGRMRARAIDGTERNYPHLYRAGEAVALFNRTDRGMFAFFACAAAAFWPLGWAVVAGGPALMRYLDDTPHRSRHEMDREREQSAKRIKDLERELGL